MPKLIVNPTSPSRREIALTRTLVSIGRDPSNDVVLPDAMVSRRHAVIEYRGSQYYVRDCNSSNGSLVNGDKVSERSLRDGDLMAIGTARLLFREEAAMEDAGAKVVQHPSSPKLHCPACSADYRKGDLFCRQCGGTLAPPAASKVVCSSCGTVVPLPAKFCNACGFTLDEPAGGTAPAKPEPDPDPGPAPAPAPPGEPPPAGPQPPSPREARSSSGDGRPPTGDGRPPTGDVRPPSGDLRPSRSGPIAAAAARPSSSPAVPAASLAQPPAPLLRSVPPLAGPPKTQEGVYPDTGLRLDEPAPLFARFLAALVDGLVVAALQAILLAPAGYYWWSHEFGTPGDVTFTPIMLSIGMLPLVLALGGAYYVYYWGVKGATPGKRILGLAVQADDGTMPIGVSRATVRALGYMLSALLLGIGFIMIAFTGAGLHDRMAGTRVVRSTGPGHTGRGERG